MERDFAGVHLSPEAHETLVSACLPEGRLPNSYADWLKLVAEGTEQATQDGRPVDEIVLNVQEFLAWCRSINVHASFDALRAYLILRRGGSAVLPGRRANKAGNAAGDTAPSAPASPASGKRGSTHRSRLPDLWLHLAAWGLRI
jgi:hypothetical protein